jgi:hypothetical protein
MFSTGMHFHPRRATTLAPRRSTSDNVPLWPPSLLALIGHQHYAITRTPNLQMPLYQT